MANIGGDPEVAGLLEELLAMQQDVSWKDSVINKALVEYRVSLRKYAAVRDAIMEMIGRSPYSKDVEWPDPSALPKTIHGRYRFALMKPGDAIVEALREDPVPKTLDEIVTILRGGRMTPAEPRTVNAALMNTKGVEKTAEGKYIYKPVPLTDSFPFTDYLLSRQANWPDDQ